MNKSAVKKRPSNIPQSILIALIALLCLMMLLPFMWTLSTSLRTPADSFKMPPAFFPTSFRYQNYTQVFVEFPFHLFIFNSFKVALITVGLNIIVTTMAAFSFARIHFFGKNICFVLLLSGLMIPAQATMIPVFTIISNLKLVNTHWALIIPAIVSPLSIFLVRQFMITIPKSYEEAAEIDGAGRWLIYWRIFLPMCKPAVVMAVIQCFFASWNNFMSPLIYLSDWDKMTLPIGLRTLQGYMGAGNICQILAGVTISLIPPVLLYLFGQRYLVEGIALTGVKS